MKKLLSATIAAGVLMAALTAAPKQAQAAHTNFFLSLGFPSAPVIYTPPPPRVIYRPQPAYYYYNPWSYYRSYHRDWRHDRDRHHWDHHDRDRDHDWDRHH